MATANALRLIPRVVKQTGQSCTASVLFLHGSGDTGEGLSEWVNSLSSSNNNIKMWTFPHIRILYPTAPSRPYTPMNGQLSNVWFDRLQISQRAPEVLESIDEMCSLLNRTIQEEVDSGIPKSRIVIGGFSMGGAMALHLAYRYHRDVAGVFALSSFINDDSAIYEALRNRSHDEPLPPLFYCHGEKDELAYLQWAKDSFDKLTSLGVQGTFHTLPQLYHALNMKELSMLQKWIQSQLPDDVEQTGMSQM